MKFLESLKNCVAYKIVSPSSAQIVTQAKMPNGKYIALMLEKNGDNWVLSDKKQTLKFMNTIYELKAKDVISCIENVLKIYKLKLQSGEIVTSFSDEKQLIENVYKFIMCIAQLVNMYAFFDAPN